jgi:hypothetical protein
MRSHVAILALLCLGCATSDVARETTARAQLTHALDMYILAHPRHPYPARKQDLVSFASAHRIPLDLSFTTSWKMFSPDTLIVGWKPGPSQDTEKILIFSTNPI